MSQSAASFIPTFLLRETQRRTNLPLPLSEQGGGAALLPSISAPATTTTPSAEAATAATAAFRTMPIPSTELFFALLTQIESMVTVYAQKSAHTGKQPCPIPAHRDATIAMFRHMWRLFPELTSQPDNPTVRARVHTLWSEMLRVALAASAPFDEPAFVVASVVADSLACLDAMATVSREADSAGTPPITGHVTPGNPLVMCGINYLARLSEDTLSGSHARVGHLQSYLPPLRTVRFTQRLTDILELILYVPVLTPEQRDMISGAITNAVVARDALVNYHCEKVCREVLFPPLFMINWGFGSSGGASNATNGAVIARGAHTCVWTFFDVCRSTIHRWNAIVRGDTGIVVKAFSVTDARPAQYVLAALVRQSAEHLFTVARMWPEMQAPKLAQFERDVLYFVLFVRLLRGWLSTEFYNEELAGQLAKLVTATRSITQKVEPPPILMEAAVHQLTLATSSPLSCEKITKALTNEERLQNFAAHVWQVAPLTNNELMSDCTTVPWGSTFARRDSVRVIAAGEASFRVESMPADAEV